MASKRTVNNVSAVETIEDKIAELQALKNVVQFVENEIETSGVEIYVRYTQDSTIKKIHTFFPSPFPQEQKCQLFIWKFIGSKQEGTVMG